MERKYLVYIHKNKINNKVYIGITRQSINERWRSHGQGYKSQQKFWRAIEKYGWDNFEHIIYKTHLNMDEAGQIEQQLIEEYDSIKNGYNTDKGGSTTNHSEETCQKIRNSMLGKTHTIETKEKISQAKDQDKKPVYCIETNQHYSSLAEASIKTNIDKSSISKVCYGKMNSAGGYHWAFENTQPIILQDKRIRSVKCITTGKIYQSISEAAKDTNSDISNIRKVCMGKYKTTNKLAWEFVEDE